VVDYLCRDCNTDFLFSGNEHDPMINCDLDAYEFCNGKPWCSFVLISEGGAKCFMVVFDSYRSKVAFLQNNYQSKFGNV